MTDTAPAAPPSETSYSSLSGPLRLARTMATVLAILLTYFALAVLADGFRNPVSWRLRDNEPLLGLGVLACVSWLAAAAGYALGTPCLRCAGQGLAWSGWTRWGLGAAVLPWERIETMAVESDGALRLAGAGVALRIDLVHLPREAPFREALVTHLNPVAARLGQPAWSPAPSPDGARRGTLGRTLDRWARGAVLLAGVLFPILVFALLEPGRFTPLAEENREPQAVAMDQKENGFWAVYGLHVRFSLAVAALSLATWSLSRRAPEED
ncbi:MAG: hypothetical protein L6R28_03775 [Planctomycetes bacterium]|nr:hypothetical protein [Planctomycetota bacterium]